MPCWLIKSEPSAYSFEQLVKEKKTSWTGIRNYTARNNLRAMKKGDLLLFYHSNIGKSVVGVAKVLKEHYPEQTNDGDWSAVDIAAVKPFAEPVTLGAMREHPKLADMTLWKLGRLSVVPVTQAEYAVILALGKTAP
jgi:predicted RNA-binding protein with PUA-like domain